VDDAPPSNDTGDMVPVVLPLIDVKVVADGPNGIGAGVLVLATVVPCATLVPGGAANVDGLLGVGLAVTGADELVCVVCADTGEQLTLVPGVVGSEASGTGASVVSAVPGWVVAENGLGPVRGDDTIAPGVDGRPIAVLPMVEICARLALQPASRMAVVSSKRRIAIPPSAPP
jgi:hypothetical protein